MPVFDYMLSNDVNEEDYEYGYESDYDNNKSLHSECEKININTDYYEIFFKLPKKERYNLEFKEDFLQKKSQRSLEKYKYEANIKYFNLKNKHKENDLITNIDLFIKDFTYFYNDNLTQCNYICNKTDIYDKMIEIGEKEKISISDLRNKLTKPEYLEFIGIKKEDINSFIKYKLWRKYYKSTDLINTFNDKIKYIKNTVFRLRKWGSLQYNAFKDYMYDIIYENYPEYNILPYNTLCLTCKFPT